MTSLSLPSGGAAHAAASPASNELAGQRNAAGRRDTEDGSAFDGLLGALDNAGAPGAANVGVDGAQAARPADAAIFLASPSALSANGGSGAGVLVGLGKQQAACAGDIPSDTPEKKTSDEAATASPLDSALALLLLGASGGAIAPPLAKAPPANGGSSAPTSFKDAGAPRETKGDGPILPSERTTLAPLAPAATPNGGAPPVAVTVVRSITYLGLDPAGGANGARRPTPSASPAPPSSAVNPADAKPANAAPAADAFAHGSPEGGGDQPSAQNGSNRGGSSGDPSRSAAGGSAAAAGAATTATAGATWAGDIAVIQINQLAGFIADAASAMDSQSVASPVAAGAAAARATPVKELDVQLNPKSLGALSIQMRLSNGALNITIAAGSPDTLKLVAAQSGAISDRLKSLDLSAASVTVKAMDAAAPTGAGGEAARPGTQGHGGGYQDRSGQSAGGSPHDGQSFQGGAQRHTGRPQRSGLAEPGGNPGHRFV